MKPDSAFAAMVRTHGGNLAAARQLFQQAPDPWIDLSTGINPSPYPVGTIPDRAFAALPEPAQAQALEAAAAKAWRVDNAASVVAAPGSQAIIQALPALLAARRIAVLGHTYGGHAAVWRNAGREVTQIEDSGRLVEFDLAVVVNPNNPDGRTLPLRGLTRIATQLAASGGLLVVDEAFVEASAGSRSLAPYVRSCEALVLRSFGKIYGLAGLRLGFAVAPPGLAVRLRAGFGPWAVSGPAIAVGARALADADWLRDTQARLADGSARLDRLLRQGGFDIIGGTPLFRLARHADAQGWFERLGAAGILVRPFAERPDALRFGQPGSEADWARLAAVLARS